MDRYGDAGAAQGDQCPDQAVGAVKALRCVAKAQGDPRGTVCQGFLQKVVELTVLPICQVPVLKAGDAGPKGAHAHQYPPVEPQGDGLKLFLVCGQRGYVQSLRQAARNGGQILQQGLPVSAADRGQGQAAVAVQDRGQALGQLGAAEVREEDGAVGVAVDVDEARSQIPSRGVDDMGGGGVSQLPHSGNDTALNSHIRRKGRGAGAVQDPGVLNQIVVQKVHLVSSATV